MSVPRGEQPGQDELSIPIEDGQRPYFERGLIQPGKRSRTQRSQRSDHREFGAEEDSLRSPPPQSTGVIDLTADTPKPPTLPAAQRSATGGASEESSEDVSRGSSRRTRRSTARKSYGPEVEAEDDDDDNAIVYERSSGRRRSRGVPKAPITLESDFEEEASEQESEIEIGEESQPEEDDPESAESMDEGYDSGVKLKRRNTSRKGNGAVKPTASTKNGTSKTGKVTGKATATEMEKLLNRKSGEAKGLDTGLPPLSSIDDIFKDIVTKALDMGLKKILHKSNRQPLRVATMCSGTESPLLALEMVQDALKSLGEPELHFDHLFSAEIVPYKQAYIERNFTRRSYSVTPRK